MASGLKSVPGIQKQVDQHKATHVRKPSGTIKFDDADPRARGEMERVKEFFKTHAQIPSKQPSTHSHRSSGAEVGTREISASLPDVSGSKDAESFASSVSESRSMTDSQTISASSSCSSSPASDNRDLMVQSPIGTPTRQRSHSHSSRRGFEESSPEVGTREISVSLSNESGSKDAESFASSVSESRSMTGSQPISVSSSCSSSPAVEDRYLMDQSPLVTPKDLFWSHRADSSQNETLLDSPDHHPTPPASEPKEKVLDSPAFGNHQRRLSSSSSSAPARTKSHFAPLGIQARKPSSSGLEPTGVDSPAFGQHQRRLSEVKVHDAAASLRTRFVGPSSRTEPEV